jgi:hypothetical protein
MDMCEKRKMTKNLEQRFLHYLSSLPNAENIDELDILKEKQENKKADYFVFNRNLIIELKTLKTDSKHKVDSEVDKHRDRDEFPVIYGNVDLQKILAHLPDGEKINAKIFEKVTRSIEQGFRSADKQIADTKDTFNVSQAIGLLVILNESIDVISPDVITWKVSQMLTKKANNGNVRYNNIVSVWIINESHFTYIENKIKGIPTIIVYGPNAQYVENIDNVFNFLQKEWANSNKLPIYFQDQKDIKDITFKSFLQEKSESSSLKPMHEIWRNDYKKNPYLRKMKKSELLIYGANLMSEMKPYFLKGEPKPSEAHYHKFGVISAHFIEEMSFRGLDWREILQHNKKT